MLHNEICLFAHDELTILSSLTLDNTIESARMVTGREREYVLWLSKKIDINHDYER